MNKNLGTRSRHPVAVAMADLEDAAAIRHHGTDSVPRCNEQWSPRLVHSRGTYLTAKGAVQRLARQSQSLTTRPPFSRKRVSSAGVTE